MASAQGSLVVLTADRTLTADYRLLFDGMLAASQTTTAPPWLTSWLVMPRHRRRGAVRAATAPLGLRRIEAALLQGGFAPDEVLVVDDTQLHAAIGPATRVIGISSGEPAGLGMNSSTMTGIAGGRVYPEAMFRQLMRKLRRVLQGKGVSAKVVLGGPGAWQLAGDADRRRELGVDHVVAGYVEEQAAGVFRSLARGEALPAVIDGGWTPRAAIPAIRAASTMGVVEISRGCGLGCAFCAVARVPMVHLPPETILADAQTNVRAGMRSIAALSEDFFRYGGEGLRVDPPALLGLLDRLRQIPELGLIQIDHANICSIAQFSDEQLALVRQRLVGRSGCRYLWVNVGVESASGRLVRDCQAAGKMNRCPPDLWGEFCQTQVRRLCRAGFLPMVSLLLGQPGETADDVRQTRAWVRSLSGEAVTIFPLLYAPLDASPPPGIADLNPLHWTLIRDCYRLNFRWIPRMYWDNQAAAGVSLLKRLTVQLLGRGQMLQWRGLFAWHAWRARRRASRQPRAS